MTRVADDRWPTGKAREWSQGHPWFVGCNFIPSTAANQIEMWQAESFDLATIERELGWAADLGFNIVRVYLHDLVAADDPAGLVERVDRVLEVAHSNGIATMLVLFDDCWNPDPQLGPQPEALPGKHNSRWAQGPGIAALRAYEGDDVLRSRLRAYTELVVGAFGADERVVVWDLYNEPGGLMVPSAEPVGSTCLPLLRDAFAWARAVDPIQPLTSGLWTSPRSDHDPTIRATQLEHSDIVSFHHYGPVEELRAICDELATDTDRPLICTEYLARQLGSRFETHLPVLRERGIDAINWGLVGGRTQTFYPWWSWLDEEPQPEPEVWFQDVLRPDGSPFDGDEAAFLRGALAGDAH